MSGEIIPENRRASEGRVWQCCACGKLSEDLYGMIGRTGAGWDESCMLNAKQVPAPDGRAPQAGEGS